VPLVHGRRALLQPSPADPPCWPSAPGQPVLQEMEIEVFAEPCYAMAEFEEKICRKYADSKQIMFAKCSNTSWTGRFWRATSVPLSPMSCASAVALPPGAAHRSTTRLPGCGSSACRATTNQVTVRHARCHGGRSTRLTALRLCAQRHPAAGLWRQGIATCAAWNKQVHTCPPARRRCWPGSAAPPPLAGRLHGGSIAVGAGCALDMPTS
jgi:hypothetical protein